MNDVISLEDELMLLFPSIERELISSLVSEGEEITSEVLEVLIEVRQPSHTLMCRHLYIQIHVHEIFHMEMPLIMYANIRSVQALMHVLYNCIHTKIYSSIVPSF
jgi:hypothetical protein